MVLTASSLDDVGAFFVHRLIFIYDWIAVVMSCCWWFQWWGQWGTDSERILTSIRGRPRPRGRRIWTDRKVSSSIFFFYFSFVLQSNWIQLNLAKMSESTEVALVSGNPYKIVDYTREKRKGITASSLEELTNVARCRLSLSADADLTIVLEQDGKKNFTFFLYANILMKQKRKKFLSISPVLKIHQSPSYYLEKFSAKKTPFAFALGVPTGGAKG